MTYDPNTHAALTFHDSRANFVDRRDSPREYLERCLNVIAEREGQLKGWVVMNPAGARAAADASARRYRDGRPLSAIDGMPVGIKDLIETRDMPTQMGCAAFDGNFPKNDSAVVRALRDAGAIILGKTVTTALGFLDPGPTTNAFDPLRTPGGSSSGSAAVVGANMVPMAIGSQLVGSVLRPASFNGNWALKPTFGALNRGERLGLSQAHLGVHANSVEDMWTAAAEIAQRSGGDPGHPGLYGPLHPPAAQKPGCLVALETEGWERAEPEARQAFEACLQTLSAQGVTVIRRGDSALVEALERAISQAAPLSLKLIAWEQRWSLANLVENHPDTLGPSLLRQLESGRGMSLAEYRECLLLREHARQCLAALATQCDALLSLNACGAAPLAADIRDSKYPTGDVSFACASSLLGAPAINVPAMAVDRLPLGLQVLGMPHGDAKITAIATWLFRSLQHRL